MSTFTYAKVGQYGKEVVTYIERNKGVLKATDQKKYTIYTGKDGTYSLFADLIKKQKFDAAETLLKTRQFEVIEPVVRPDRFTTLGWTQIEKSVFTSKTVKISTAQQEKITLLVIKNVLGDDGKTYKSFDEMFNAKKSEIRDIFPDLPKIPSWYNHFDLQFREITKTRNFPNGSYNVYLYDGKASFMDYVSDLVTAGNKYDNKGLGLYSKKDSWDPADIWLVRSKQIQDKYIKKFEEIKKNFIEGYYAENKFQSIKDINIILKDAYHKRDIVGISLKKSNQKTLKYTEFNLEANPFDQKLPDIKFDSIALDASYNEDTGFNSKTSYVYVTDKGQDSYKLAFKSNTGGGKIGNITYEFLPSAAASAFLGKVPKDKLKEWLIEQIKTEKDSSIYMPQGSMLKETFDPFYKQQWENKVKLIKKHFGDFTELDNFVDNLEKSYNKFGLSVKNSSMMQMVDFVWIMAKLKENKNLIKFLSMAYYFAQKKGQIYNFGPFGKLY